MGMVDDIKKAMKQEFDKWATTTCVDALRSSIAASCDQHTGTLIGSAGSQPINDKLYHVGVTAPYGKYVDEGRGEVVPSYPPNALYNKEYGFGPVAHAGPAKPRRFIAGAVARLG